MLVLVWHSFVIFCLSFVVCQFEFFIWRVEIIPRILKILLPCPFFIILVYTYLASAQLVMYSTSSNYNSSKIKMLFQSLPERCLGSSRTVSIKVNNKQKQHLFKTWLACNVYFLLGLYRTVWGFFCWVSSSFRVITPWCSSFRFSPAVDNLQDICWKVTHWHPTLPCRSSQV